jgi:hypothetical protein
MRLRRLIGLLTAVGTASAVTAVVAGPAQSAPQIRTVAFGVTGDLQTFTVPAGVKSLSLTVAGGSGALARDLGSGNFNYPGGNGAVVSTTVPVKEGQVLTLSVGDVGTPLDISVPVNRTSCPAAFGGGGVGGYMYGGPNEMPTCGPGGGGASDIRTGPALTDRIVVAGGGGSGGARFGGYWRGCPEGASGAPGGASAAPGTVGCNDVFEVVSAGQPGTATSGGAGGIHTNRTFDDGSSYDQCKAPLHEHTYRDGGNGTLGVGGAAGVQNLEGHRSNYVPIGGAGGGGLYGGGGGAPSMIDNSGFMCPGLSGGGGGSSYLASGLVGRVEQGANVGTGSITITYTTR